MPTEPLRLRDLIEQLQEAARRYGDDLRVSYHKQLVLVGRNTRRERVGDVDTLELDLPLR